MTATKKTFEALKGFLSLNAHQKHQNQAYSTLGIPKNFSNLSILYIYLSSS